MNHVQEYNYKTSVPARRRVHTLNIVGAYRLALVLQRASKRAHSLFFVDDVHVVMRQIVLRALPDPDLIELQAARNAFYNVARVCTVYDDKAEAWNAAFCAERYIALLERQISLFCLSRDDFDKAFQHNYRAPDAIDDSYNDRDLTFLNFHLSVSIDALENTLRDLQRKNKK